MCSRGTSAVTATYIPTGKVPMYSKSSPYQYHGTLVVVYLLRVLECFYMRVRL